MFQTFQLIQSEIEFFVNPERRSTGSTIITTDQTSNPLSNFLSTNTTGPDENFQMLDESTNTPVLDEIEAFFKSPTLDINSDSLAWWKNNNDYNRIKQLVPRFLCPPPGTVESERTFSKLSEIYSQRRSNLSAEHAKMQPFLHFNFDD
uniref:HAT C-terminal dimerisation domain-containing protein n=1 Tax=Meloidogyne incognita TaxID=6306 RepID=A0A914NLB4_MELIC